MFRRVRLIALFAVIFLLTLRFYTQRRSILDVTEGKTSGPWREEWGFPAKKSHRKGGNNTANDEADEYADYLRELGRNHGLTNNIPFFARRIKPKYSSPSLKTRPSLTQVKNPLMKSPHGFVRARLDNDHLRVHPVDPTPLTLPIARTGPKPPSIDASSLLFGISTTYARLSYANNAILHDWAAWLTDGRGTSNGAGLVLTLHGATEAQVTTIRHALHHLGIDVSLTASQEGDTDSGGRYAQLVQQMMRHRHLEPERTWFALVDDDVFFPCVGRLLSRLQTFDHTSAYYVGVPSERADWVVDSNIAMTYGGGAVFLTAGMLDMAGQLLCLQYTTHGGHTGDVDEPNGMTWDESLYKCIARNAPDVRLHILPGLYSPSHQPNPSSHAGGYGSGMLPLALHRYRNYHRFEAGKGHVVASACGEECFLQRFLFKDSWVLVNGYTLTHFPEGVTAQKHKAPKKNNKTNADSDEGAKPGERLTIMDDDDTNFQTGERHSLSWKGRKKTWRLLDARIRDNGEVWQAYVNRKGGGNSVSADMDERQPGDVVHHDEEERSDVDSVVVLVWEAQK